MIKKTFQFICPSLIFFPSFDGRFCPDRPVERRDEDDFCCISSSRPAKDAILGPRFFLSSEFGPATAMSTTEEHDPILSKQQEDNDRPILQKPQKFQSLAVELFSNYNGFAKEKADSFPSYACFGHLLIVGPGGILIIIILMGFNFL